MCVKEGAWSLEVGLFTVEGRELKTVVHACSFLTSNVVGYVCSFNVQIFDVVMSDSCVIVMVLVA
jgi:hypothetical protein